MINSFHAVEDIKLNSQVFHWPENIKAVFMMCIYYYYND